MFYHHRKQFKSVSSIQMYIAALSHTQQNVFYHHRKQYKSVDYIQMSVAAFSQTQQNVSHHHRKHPFTGETKAKLSQ